MNAKTEVSHAALMPAETTELLILPDGTLYAHNLSAAVAALLGELNPFDLEMRRRAEAARGTETAPA